MFSHFHQNHHDLSWPEPGNAAMKLNSHGLVRDSCISSVMSLVLQLLCWYINQQEKLQHWLFKEIYLSLAHKFKLECNHLINHWKTSPWFLLHWYEALSNIRHFGLVHIKELLPLYSGICLYTQLPTKRNAFTWVMVLLKPQVLDIGRLWLLSISSNLLIQNHN